MLLNIVYIFIKKLREKIPGTVFGITHLYPYNLKALIPALTFFKMKKR